METTTWKERNQHYLHVFDLIFYTSFINHIVLMVDLAGGPRWWTSRVIISIVYYKAPHSHSAQNLFWFQTELYI